MPILMNKPPSKNGIGMELTKTKFKQTEVGLIPEDWNYDLLDNHTKRGSGHTPNKKIREYYEGSIVWVSLADSDKLDRGKIDSSQITISMKGIANSSAVLHPKGVVLMSRDAGIGKSGVAGCQLCVSQHFITWDCNEKTIHNWFLYYWLQFKKKEFERIAIGSTIKTIGLPFFKKYNLVLPQFEEQKAIATALSDVDELIAKLEKLIEKKKAIKQGAMQALLTPPHKGGKRLEGFSGDWVEKKLGNVADFFKGKGLPKSEINESGKFKCIHYGELFTKYNQIISSIKSRTNKTNDAFYSKSNDVLMPTSDVTPNGLATSSSIYEDDVVLGGDILVIRPKPEILGSYLSYQVANNKHQIMTLISGTTVYHLYGSDMAKFKFYVPEIEEQKAIVSIFIDLEAEILKLETERFKTISIKHGMMQELLTGRTRLV